MASPKAVIYLYCRKIEFITYITQARGTFEIYFEPPSRDTLHEGIFY